MSTIRNIAFHNDKKNKTRSILVMLTIFLSTALLMIISTFCNGLIKMNLENAESNYGYFYGVYGKITADQLKEMERRSEIVDIGLLSDAGIIQSEYIVKFITADEKALSLTKQDNKLIVGKFPQAENEIAADASFFKSMGYENIKVGDVVEIPYRKNLSETYHTISFVVSGLLVDNNIDTSKKNFTVYCSKDFYQATYKEEERRFYAYFRLHDTIDVDMNNVEETLIQIAEKCGIDDIQVKVNSSYLWTVLQPQTEAIIVGVFLSAIVIIFSVIVIYNIFQVGIIQKVQEYGKIKALGATKRQMRKLIYQEGMLLAIPSIPLGIVVGYVVSYFGFHWLIEQSRILSENDITYTFSLFSMPVILLSIGAALLTVILALQKPMKIVSKISPVEAVRYQESTSRKKGGIRKRKGEVSVFSIVLANITGNRKRTLSTIFTMGLSCVMFIVIANCAGNIDIEHQARREINHGQFQIKLDYSLTDKAYPENNLDEILKDNPLNHELIDKIKEIPGVTDIETRQILWAKVNDEIDTVSIMPKEDFNFAKSKTNIGNMNYDEGVKNKSIFYGWSHFIAEYGFAIDQPVSMTLYNGTEEYEFKGSIAGSFGSLETGWAIPEEVYKEWNLNGNSIGYIWIDCKEKDVIAVEKALNDLLDDVEHIEVETYHNVLSGVKMATRITKLGCYLFTVIVGLVGFMNLANTMIISITTQKQEYGILQAVAMTNKQLNKCLQIQGLVFTVGTIFVALIVGLPSGYGLFQYISNKGWFGMNVYHLPLKEVLAMIGAIAFLQLILSFILSRNLKKETLVERIRYQE